MRSHMKNVLLSIVSVGFALALTLFGLVYPVQAAPDTIYLTFTDTTPIEYTDLEGTILGEGVFVGGLRCINDHCNQRIEFTPNTNSDPLVFEYRFKTLSAFDPTFDRVVVTGTGTIISGSSRSGFLFTGVFQNNVDGTVNISFHASNPNASFIFPAIPGTFATPDTL